MGGAESSSKYGGMVVQLDSPFFISGSQVTGRISVMINQPYPALRLKLKVEGKEYCRWYERKTTTSHYGGRSHNETHYEKHDHSETIFNYEVIIYEFYQQSINPGQYVFPFSFFLPKECPSSTYFTGDESAYGVISYKCIGVFDSIGGGIQPITNECNIIVRQTKKEVNANLQSYSESQVDKCCCCCSGGTTKVGALFEKDAYSTSEVAKALVNINNTSSTLKVNHVSMKLIQHVSLNTNGHNYRRAYTVCKQQFPGIEAGQFCENKPLEINLAESKQTFHSDSQEETHKLNNEEVKFAEFIQPTSNGRWVNIQYEIQINCGMGGTCCSCSNDPKCSVSMFLQPPLIPLYNQVQPPSNWNPTVYKAREFDMPDQVYIPYDPNAYQKPIKYNYGQNAEASEDSDEPVSASGEEDSDESASENRV